MKKINIKNEYEWILEDTYIEISDDIAKIFDDYARAEHRYREKVRYHKAYYSLNANNGIENDVISPLKSLYEEYEQKLTQAALYRAIKQLSDKQAKRIYAHYFLNISMVKIAKMEGVDESAVRHSVHRALKKIKKLLTIS